MTAQLHEKIETALRTQYCELLERAFDIWSASGPGDWEVEWPLRIDGSANVMTGEAIKVLASDAAGHVTMRCDIATGESTLAKAPGQGESRVVLDGSCERNRLAAFRGFCRLFGDREQKFLAVAREVSIVTAPVDEWIAENTPHPDGPCEGLRLIIVLPPQPSPPPSDDSHHADCLVAARVAVQKARISHYETCRRAAHVAVIKARCVAGRSTQLHISAGGSDFGDSNGTLAEFLASSPPQRVFRVELSAKSFTEDWLPGPQAENVMLLLDAPDWPRGVETVGLFATGESAEYWRDVLSKLHRSDDRWRSAPIVQSIAYRLENERSALHSERPKWLH